MRISMRISMRMNDHGGWMDDDNDHDHDHDEKGYEI